mmetsp:Transcript_87937/g.169247  ORF Transcript_87937/g.169247 Transcript_87937/m.169247 type:complete len:127 (-) Transcript_87937:68-448(-)
MHMRMDDCDFRSSFAYNMPKRRREPEWSYATSFARGGIEPGQGLKGRYTRDPHTGVWHKVRDDRLPGLIDQSSVAPVSSAGAKAGSWGMMQDTGTRSPSASAITRDRVMHMTPTTCLSMTIKQQPL